MQTKNYLAVHYIIRAIAVVATPIKKQQVPFLTFQESTLGTLAQFFHLQKHKHYSTETYRRKNSTTFVKNLKLSIQKKKTQNQDM